MFTTNLRLLTAGESHGPELIAFLEGMPAGLPLHPEVINPYLYRRQRGYGAGARMKIEHDEVEIVSGIMNGITTGGPIAMRIINADHEKWRGKAVTPLTAPRPGHVDLVAAIKYGYDDLRPGLERASARETAARVAAGSICAHFLSQFGVVIGGYVTQIGNVSTDFHALSYEERFSAAEESEVRCPDPASSDLMVEAIRKAIFDRDTLGGIIEIAALHLPPGLGSHVHWDRRLEARIGGAVLSVQAMKGVEFGEAFENTALPGTQAHDAIRLEGSRIIRPTNRAGGVEGGITNGEPLVVRAAMKPIATTLTPQQTVDLASGEEKPTTYERSDFCPVPRAVPILETVIAHILADALLDKVGGDSLEEIQPRVAALRKASLEDLRQKGNPTVFWD